MLNCNYCNITAYYIGLAMKEVVYKDSDVMVDVLMHRLGVLD